MTRAKKTDLVLDGNEVKLRLTAERQKTKQIVHVHKMDSNLLTKYHTTKLCN